MDELVEELNVVAGVRTACLSNTNHAHWVCSLAGEAGRVPSRAIGALGVKLASHDLGLIKPDPAIYAEAERRFATAAERIVFFDDLPDNVAAARRAGWRAHHIDHQADTAAQMRRTLEGLGIL